MSISLNIVVAIAFLMGISFTHVAVELGWKERSLHAMPAEEVTAPTKAKTEEGKDYSLPSLFLFDKNS